MYTDLIDSYMKAFDGGARQYLFRTKFNIPSMQLNVNSDIEYYVKTANLPETSFEEAAIPYPGYTFKMAGNKVYGDWTVTLMVDKENSILNAFSNWQRLIYNPSTQVYAAAKDYMRDQILMLLDYDYDGIEAVKSEYTLIAAWPKVIGPLTLDYSSTDLVTVDITFAYQYYLEKEQKTADYSGED